MSSSFEEKLLEKYKNIKPSTVKQLIPFIDIFRSIQNKPPIPVREKMVEMKLPVFEEPVIMVHGVSVGEIMSLEKVILAIKENFEGYRIVVTTGTLTGHQLAYKKYGELVDFITYFPLDVYDCCKKFIQTLNPKAILVAETEIWPNFALCCKENKVPLYIINGRISDKSYPSYSRLRNFLRVVLKYYSGIFCQSAVDKDRFIMLGAVANTTEVMKNLKFEIEKKECDIDLKQGSSKVLIAGSTHPGEDEIIIKVYKQLRSRIIDLKLILAPRHPNRLPEIVKILKSENIRYGLRSKNDNLEGTNNVLVLDTIGELSKMYAVADVAFIGGSLDKKTGGHNPLEATIYSKPVVSGPCVKNFRDIYSILTDAKAAFIVKNEGMLYKTLEKLFQNNQYLEEISNNCGNCFDKNKGALEFLIGKLKQVIK